MQGNDKLTKKPAKEGLYEALATLNDEGRYPFHMPGHKRAMPDEAGFLKNAAVIDITEIEGFDDLHHAKGIILYEENRAARLFGAKKTFILAGGSSVGVMAAICSQTRPAGQLILARNSHRSAYYAVYYNDLFTQYLYPVSSDDDMEYRTFPAAPADISGLDELLKNAKTGGAERPVVFLTSPTYEGIVSDIETAAKKVHACDGILIVDEAHGAHLSFAAGAASEAYEGKCTDMVFPESATALCADIVIQSLHKTLPALTPAALLHVCSDRVDISRLMMHLSMLQTSSPSYLMMASVSNCLSVLEKNGKELFSAYEKRLAAFYERCRSLKRLKVLSPGWAGSFCGDGNDPSKIVILTGSAGIDGYTLLDILREEYKIDLEMAGPAYALAMTSICDSDEGFERLAQALAKIDEKAGVHPADEKEEAPAREDTAANPVGFHENSKPLLTKMTVKAALDAEYETVPLKDAGGRVCAEFIMRYPPGIPIVVPGEVVDNETALLIRRLEEEGANLQKSEGGIRVVAYHA